MLKTRGNKITWLGHSAFHITTSSGQVTLIDPWLSGNPKCPEQHKHPARVDTILVSHAHGDHLGDTVALAKQFQPQIACNYEIHVWLASKGVRNTMPMNKGGSQKIGDLEVTMVHAFHSSGIEDDGGGVIYGGEPAGWIVRLPGGLTLYHAGDTAVFGDMKLIADLYAPELAMLPIGDLYTMGPREAAQAIRLLNVKHVVPMHYGTFPPLTGTPEALRELTQDILQLDIHALTPGESLA